ncbi:MAG: polysaccharide biosynthesis protein [Acidobacteriota bacterium]|nr:polysaccharide biosynthesis protein [Acidobacteriota bacterium]
MRNRYLLLCDVPIVGIATYAAFALRFDWLFPLHRPEFVPFLIAVLIVKPIVFLALGMYSRLWRYASVQDLLAVLIAVTASSVAVSALVAGGTVSGRIYEFSRAVLVIDWLLTLCGTGGLRMAVRLAAENRYGQGKAARGTSVKRVLVVGAGDAGAMVVREVRRNPQLGMETVAFLDDQRSKRGKHVQGVPVVGPLAMLTDAIERYQISEIIIAMPAASGSVVRMVAEACRQSGTPSRILPGVYELLGGQLDVSRLRKVEIADLLRREQVTTRPDTGMYLVQKRVLVTGAGGSIGSELCRQIALANPAKLMLVGHGENSIFEAQSQLREHFPALKIQAVIADIRDPARLAACFREGMPQIVFHAAAHKHVPLMEENPEEAITNNVIGTSNIVDACIVASVERLVMISTDKAVSPTSMMGASKRLAEMIVREGARRSGQAFSVVRFGNVLGSRGSVVPVFKRQIERGGPITITHPDVTRFFMTIPEAVHLVLQAGGLSSGGELFVLNMGQAVPIVQLAEDLVRLSGLSAAEIPIVFTGLRPGEKLEENLWEQGALVEPTTHPEVLRVIEHDPIEGAQLARSLDALKAAAGSGERMRLEAALAQWIPSYVPSSVQKHLSL